MHSILDRRYLRSSLPTTARPPTFAMLKVKPAVHIKSACIFTTLIFTDSHFNLLTDLRNNRSFS